MKNAKKVWLIIPILLFSLNASAASKPNPARILATEICNQIETCDASLDRDLCVHDALASDQLLDEFGGPETDGTGKPFSGVQLALNRSLININLANFLSCVSSIQSLSCSSSNISYSWDSADPNNFGNLEEIVDGLTDCNAIFY